jgi:DNA topoisomerase-1
MKLLIVESPGKVKKLQGFLGSDWKVAASVGHVRDLPVKEMGLAAPDFAPHYVPTDRGREVLVNLAVLVKKAEAVYLATDPDREGEAIAWHLADALKLKVFQRVTYSEITEKAVRSALAAPRSLDMALVKAQEARRALDRFCGYLVSGPLSSASGEKLSAGRVQSPALRLVVEREKEIRGHSSVTHYGAELTFDQADHITDGWKAVWDSKPFLREGSVYLTDKAAVEKAAAIRSLTVLACEETENRAAPPAPFTTSSLQQAASNTLKLTPKRTMELAQKLYEAGTITYHRTDSPNLSQEAITAIRALAEEKGWPLPDAPRVWKAKEGAQEAHEAIRPAHAEQEIAGESEEEKALYQLIRLHALASQLADAVFAVRVLRLGADPDGKEAVFEARGRTLLTEGWKILLHADQADDTETEAENPVPALKPGSGLTALSGAVLTKKTKPAPRYPEAALVRELEKRGIGRPSTYAAILDTIAKRGYVATEKRFIVPTPLGEKVIEALAGRFAFSEYAFTRDMEQALDDIASGKGEYKAVVSRAYNQLQNELAAFLKATGKVCPKCGRAMVHRVKPGKGGYDFWGCSGYPDCKEKL